MVYRTRAARLPWLLAALLVPLLLAGVATAWSGPSIERELAARSAAALAAAGVPGATVTLDGRDATIAGVPAGQRQRALSAVAAVDGVRVARIGAGDTATGRPADPPANAGTGAGGPVTGGGAAEGGATTAGAEAGAAAGGVRPDLGAAQPMTERAAPPAVDRATLRATLAAVPPITFRPDSVRPTPQGAASVRLVGELLLAAPGVVVEVAGHVAVAPGGPANARLLSERRAAAVRDALVAAGVPAARLVPRGYGDTRPLPAAAASRRVEIIVR